MVLHQAYQAPGHQNRPGAQNGQGIHQGHHHGPQGGILDAQNQKSHREQQAGDGQQLQLGDQPLPGGGPEPGEKIDGLPERWPGELLPEPDADCRELGRDEEGGQHRRAHPQGAVRQPGEHPARQSQCPPGEGIQHGRPAGEQLIDIPLEQGAHPRRGPLGQGQQPAPQGVQTCLGRQLHLGQNTRQYPQLPQGQPHQQRQQPANHREYRPHANTGGHRPGQPPPAGEKPHPRLRRQGQQRPHDKGSGNGQQVLDPQENTGRPGGQIHQFFHKKGHLLSGIFGPFWAIWKINRKFLKTVAILKKYARILPIRTCVHRTNTSVYKEAAYVGKSQILSC